MGKVLLVDDDHQLLSAFSHILQERGHCVITSDSAEQCLTLLDSERPEIVVLDVQLPGESGIDAFRKIKSRGNPVPVIIMTGENSMQNAVEAMALGAYSYQLKPFEPEAILKEIERGLEDSLIKQEVSARDVPADLIIGRCAAMQEVYKLIGRVAPTDTTVMIRGDSGTGKELVARIIHQYSARNSRSFVAVNCLAIPEMLLESELFGHEKGAFTGADARRIGRFEQAHGGTLLLDEIGDVPLSIQGKVLRVLQERAFSRVGGEKTLTADVRVLSATNRDLEKAVAEGKFRKDLLYRLNVVTIALPSLRERIDDIPLLVNAFIRRFATELQMAPPVVSAEAMSILVAHDWPGNVRELEHCICRAMVFQRGSVLRPEHIKAALGLDVGQAVSESTSGFGPLQNAVRQYLLTRGGERAFEIFSERVERLLIREALQLAGGNQSHAAKLLGLARQTFRWKLGRLNSATEKPD